MCILHGKRVTELKGDPAPITAGLVFAFVPGKTWKAVRFVVLPSWPHCPEKSPCTPISGTSQ